MPASALRMRGKASPTIGIAGRSSSLGVTCEAMLIVGVGVMSFTGDSSFLVVAGIGVGVGVMSFTGGSSVMVVGIGDRGGGVFVVTTGCAVGFGRGKAVGGG